MAFFDLVVPFPLDREILASGPVSMGNGVFGSTFLTTRNEAISVFPPGNHSRIEFSGNR